MLSKLLRYKNTTIPVIGLATKLILVTKAMPREILLIQYIVEEAIVIIYIIVITNCKRASEDFFHIHFKYKVNL